MLRFLYGGVEVIRCKDCPHLFQLGRAKRQRGYANGRKYYYCKILKRTNGWQGNFVGFGDTTYQSPLQLKTSPKECPLRNKEKSNV